MALEKDLPLLITTFVGLVNSFLAYLVYQLNRQNRSDAFVRSYAELHDKFWNDEDFRKVRAWSANDEGYKELCSILNKRDKGRSFVSMVEYGDLEKLDKFMNFMIRAEEVDKQLDKKGLSEKLYFNFWLKKVKERPELWSYFTKNFPVLPTIKD
jgi:hypothetical protein